jgi:hypothetical protein
MTQGVRPRSTGGRDPDARGGQASSLALIAHATPSVGFATRSLEPPPPWWLVRVPPRTSELGQPPPPRPAAARRAIPAQRAATTSRTDRSSASSEILGAPGRTAANRRGDRPNAQRAATTSRTDRSPCRAVDRVPRRSRRPKPVEPTPRSPGSRHPRRADTQRCQCIEMGSLHARDLGATGRARRPRVDELPHRELRRVVVDHHRIDLGGGSVDRHRLEHARRRRLRMLRSGVGVRRDRVRRFPGPRARRDVEHRGQRDQRRRVDHLATDRTLVGEERRDRHPVEMRRQLRPGVVHGRDLGQRTDREPARFAVEHDRRPRRRREQRQAVLGERCGGPQLTTGLTSRRRTPVTDPEQAGPIAVAAPIVDEAHQPVQIDAMHQPVEVIVAFHGPAHTSGHG